VSVIAVGLNHRTVPLHVLERMTIAAPELPKALHDLTGRPHLGEVVVLSTCMRVEIYATVSRYHGAMVDVRDFLADWSGMPLEAFGDHLYAYYDDAAIGHLFRVSAGLDSAVVGETEILGQVRDAWRQAQAEGATGPAIDGAFAHAIEVGRRVRSETHIARGTTSISQAAVDLASERLGGLAGRQVLVIGAGEIGRSAARVVAAQDGVRPPLVINRTAERAEQLAAEIGGRAVPWSGLDEALAEAEVVFSCTGAPGVVIDAGRLASFSAEEGHRRVVVDLALPRDVEPAVGRLPGVTLLDLEDIKAFTAASMDERRAELPAAERILADEIVRYGDALAARSVAPLVSALRSRAEEIRQLELERQRSRLAGLDPEQAAAVDHLTRAIVAKLLHEPTVNLKAAAGTTDGDTLAATLQALFDLEP
jgi:glutamyl-tRNA reductase